MQVTRCLKLKNLEERLLCLKRRYQELTNQIADEYNWGVVSDEIGNLPQIMTEREIVQKQIRLTEKRLKAVQEMPKQQSKNGRIDIGSLIKLQNSTHCLEIRLVDENRSSPADGFISVDSPIGRAILGKRVGEKVQVGLPKGKIQYTVEEIR